MNTLFILREIATVSAVLFAVIDIVGTIPVIINIRNTAEVNPFKVSWVSLAIMVIFLFAGETILKAINLDIMDFALAGSFVIFLIAVEMLLGVNIYRDKSKASSIIPLAFPIIAGTGTLTTLLSMRSQYSNFSILAGIVINTAIVYVVLKKMDFIEKLLGEGGISIVRKVFGVVLLAIAIKIFRTNAGI